MISGASCFVEVSVTFGGSTAEPDGISSGTIAVRNQNQFRSGVDCFLVVFDKECSWGRRV